MFQDILPMHSEMGVEVIGQTLYSDMCGEVINRPTCSDICVEVIGQTLYSTGVKHMARHLILCGPRGLNYSFARDSFYRIYNVARHTPTRVILSLEFIYSLCCYFTLHKNNFD